MWVASGGYSENTLEILNEWRFETDVVEVNTTDIDDVTSCLQRMCGGVVPSMGMSTQIAFAVLFKRFASMLTSQETFTMEMYDPNDHAQVDPGTLKALDVFPDPSKRIFQHIWFSSFIWVASHAYSSLYSILNQCKTAQGSRLLETWLRTPLKNYDHIRILFFSFDIKHV